MINATDATFEHDVLDASETHPVIVDLWAEWCGPCKTLGPILEQVVGELAGEVELVKVDVDANPGIAGAFRVQSIPAVYAFSKRTMVDGFVGALPESGVREFVGRLLHPPSEADLATEQGDEASLRAALESEPDHPGAIAALSTLLIERGDFDEALALLARLPGSPETLHLSARARLRASGGRDSAQISEAELDDRLAPLYARVKSDEAARAEILDLIEALDLDDPRRARLRRELASRLY